VREAALSLAISQDFAKRFADPRQMQPYTYAGSPLTHAVVSDQSAISSRPGDLAPDVKLNDGAYLLDRVSEGFSALIFVDASLSHAQTRMLDQMKILDRRFMGIVIDLSAQRTDDLRIARVYGAAAGTVILVRPDLYILGRWSHPDADNIADALRLCLKGGL
jgi:3-(3-hydroxy-phenyl)propionate hydroxylase